MRIALCIGKYPKSRVERERHQHAEHSASYPPTVVKNSRVRDTETDSYTSEKSHHFSPTNISRVASLIAPFFRRRASSFSPATLPRASITLFFESVS